MFFICLTWINNEVIFDKKTTFKEAWNETVDILNSKKYNE
jgi:hypothetical protein